MDGLRWSEVLVQWVTHSKLIDSQFNNIEQCSVEDFYQQFRSRMQSTLTIEEDSIIDFLKERFPHYELYLNESGQIAAPDRFYIISLLLYFSCVLHPDSFFQQICNNFDKFQQIAVSAFLKSMLEGSQQRKNIDRMMIQRAIQDAMPHTMMPPASVKTEPQQPHSESQSQSSQSSVPSRITSADLLDSPLRLNNRVPRLSPPTPKTVILDERTRQLKELKAQLEAERYEKGYLEMQLKQLQDKNERFMEDKRKHLKEIRELKAEILSYDRENEPPNKQRGDTDFKVARIQRQLSDKEEVVDRLRIELETVSENNRHATEMVNYRNTQIAKLNNKILELEGSIVTLNECIEEKEEVIKCLRENNEDLQNFIKENRLQRDGEGGAVVDNLNTSFECLDLSVVASSTGTSGGTGPSPENMACAVVDVQLKEKEAENGLLKRSLEMYEQEKMRISGLVGNFFRLYDEVVGNLPSGKTVPGNLSEVGFVEKMNMFKNCYEVLFEELAKVKLGKELMEEKNDVLEEDCRRLQGTVIAKEEVLRELEVRSAEIGRELGALRKSSSEYQLRNTDLNNSLLKQKRDFLKLISEKDLLSEQNLSLNVELNSLKEEYESVVQKIDYLMVSLNEDHEDGDYSSWVEKMEDLTARLGTLKEDKERIAALNMKVTMEKIAMQKEISNSEEKQKRLQEQQAEAERKIQLLEKKIEHLRSELNEQNEKYSLIEKDKVNLQEMIDLLKTELQQNQSSLHGALKELEATGQLLESNRNDARVSNDELLEVQKRNAILVCDLENQKAIEQTLEKRQQDIITEKRQLEAKLAQLESDLLDQANRLEHAQQKNDECNKQNSLLSDRIQNLQEKNNDLEQTIVEQREISEDNLEQIDKLNVHVRRLEDLLETETQRSKALERSWNNRHEQDQQLLLDSTKEKDVLSAANRSLLSGFTLIQNGIDSLEKQYAAKIYAFQQKLDHLSTLLSKLSNQQFRMRLEKTSLEEVLVQIKEELSALQLKNEQLTIEKNSFYNEALKAQEERTAAEDHNVKLKDEMSELNVTLQLEQTKVKELSYQVQSLTVEKTKIFDHGSLTEADLRKQLNDATNLLSQLKSEAQRVELTLIETAKQLKEKVDQMKLLEKQGDEKEIRCTRLEVELTEAHMNLNNQKQLTAQGLELKCALEGELETIREELSHLKTENNRLNTELEVNIADLDSQTETVSRLCRDKELLEKKVQELATVLGVVRQSKAEVKEAFEQEREKCDELESQLSAINAKLAEVSSELNLSQDQLKTILADRDNLLSEKQELSQQIDELRETNTMLEEDRDTLREEKCRLAADVDRVDSDKEAIGEQCTKLLTELAKERETSKISGNKHEARVKSLTEELLVLENKLKAASETQLSANKKVAELEEAKRLLEISLSDKSNMETRISQLSQVVTELQSEKSQLEAEKLMIMGKLAEQSEAIEKLNANSLSLSEHKEHLEKQVTSNQTIINKLERKLQDLAESSEVAGKQIEKLEKEKVTLLDNICNHEENLSEKLTLITNLQRDLANINELHEQKCSELQSLSEQMRRSDMQSKFALEAKESVNLQHLALAEEIAEKHKEVLNKLENAQQRNDVLESDIRKLTKELELSSNEARSNHQQVEAKDKEILAAKEALTAYEEKCVEFVTKIKALTDDKTSLESRLVEARSELEAETKTLAKKQSELDEISGRLSASTETIEKLQKNSEKNQTIRATLETEIQNLNQHIDDVRSENESLKTTIVARENEIQQLTEGLGQVKNFQLKLETKVTDYETTVAEKDKLDMKLKQLQDEGKCLLAEKSDIERRLIQQLQEYDTLNDAYLNELDVNKTMKLNQQEQDRKMRSLSEEISHLTITHEGTKAQLLLKEKMFLEKDKQMDRLKQEIEELFGKNRQVDTLTQQVMTIKMQKMELEVKRDALQDIIQQQEVQGKTMQENLQQLRDSLRSKQQEVDSLHSELTSVKDVTHVLKIENSKLKSNQELEQTKLLNLELKIAEQSKKIDQLEQSLSKTELSHLEDNSKASTLLKKLETYKQYEVKVRELEELHQKEREINEKCQMDIDILRAKLIKNRKITEEQEQQWNHERKVLMAKCTEDKKTSEQNVNEIRADYEEKLARLKEKMHTLLNEQLHKSTVKHETDFKDLKAQLAEEMKKFSQLEAHVFKVQQQLSMQNERNLELMKEYEFAKSKLRILEGIREERRSMLPPPTAQSRLASNLKMEDEEGEIFNNTYLTDLKTGRMSPPHGRESVPLSVLNQRNSMVPPHLKCSYSVQYNDGDATDEENRDAAYGGLDDSSASLISRKKVGGTTTYKRPGPPTPSKKGGRLSFGGTLPANDFQYKEILKEGSNGGGGSTLGSRLSFGGRKSNVDSGMLAAGGNSMALAELNSRRKTPGKFTKMFSSSNLLNQLSKDEAPKSPKQIEASCVGQLAVVPATGTNRVERPIQAKSKRDSLGGALTCVTRRSHKASRLRKSTRFDQNRRLSSADSDSPTSVASARDSSDPYNGFSYDGTSDRLRKIDINSLDVFRKADPSAANVVVFRGERKDSNNNNFIESSPIVPNCESQEIDAITSKNNINSSNDIETSNFVQRLGDHRRAKNRRKSRDQRRELFNCLRNIHEDAILQRSNCDDYSSEEDSYTVVLDSSQSKFESLAQQKSLERPSEILPRNIACQSLSKKLLDPFNDVVTSSTGLNSLASFPLLDRLSEIFRVGTLQREKINQQQSPTVKPKQDQEIALATKAQFNDQNYRMLVAFTGLSFSALVFSLYLHYVDFRVNRR